MTLSVEMIAESMQPFGARVVMQQERTFAFRRVQMLTPESENTLEEDVLYVGEPKVIRRLPKGLLHDHFFVVRARPEDAEPVRPGVNALLYDEQYSLGAVTNHLLTLFDRLQTLEYQMRLAVRAHAGLEPLMEVGRKMIPDATIVVVDSAYNIIGATRERGSGNIYVDQMLEQGYYPIVQGCMQWISRAPLVAAVSEAGGLGLLSSSTFSSADELQAEIRKIKSMTSKPFAVNLTLMPSLVVPDYAGYIRVCAEEGVKVMETAGRPPKDDMVRAIKDAGMVLIHKCTTVKHALKAQSLGADMVVADGFECAGHPGENDLGTMVLTPRCVEALDIPVICAGGVSTGRQMAAALMLGAEGVYMGTRFLLSEECPVLPAVKNYLVEHANEMETILLLRSFQNSTRMYKSEVAKRVFAKEQAGCEFKDVAEDMAGKTACKMFFENADVENCGVICCGQTSGLIHDVLPVQTIIGQMMHECEATIAKFA